MAPPNLILQEGAGRFIVETGFEHGIQLGRIFDWAANTLSREMPVASLMAHSAGWEDVSLNGAPLQDAQEAAEKLLIEQRGTE